MDFSVIICTYNRSRHLRNVLETLALQDVPDDMCWEILVIDNNSTDDTRAVVEEFMDRPDVPVRYFREEKQGLSHARNRGVVESQGTHVAFTDDDALADKGWVTALYKTFQSYGCDCCGGKIHLKPERPLPGWLTEELWGFLGFLDYGDAPRILEAEYVFGGNIALTRDILEKTGLFDPDLGRRGDNLTGGEETDLQRRIRMAGGTVVYQPNALVYHVIGEEKLRKEFFKRLHYCEGITFGRAFSGPAGKQIGGIPLFVLPQLSRSVFKYLVQPSVRRLMNVWWFIGYMKGRRAAHFDGSV